MDAAIHIPSREQLLHRLYEAAELEHDLMCTYLYAAFSLKSGEEEGLGREEAAATARWRRTILDVAIDEMGHLAAVWNITSALGGVPRFGRGNFPLDPGYLPAGVVVKLAPFNAAVLQHFIHLERPEGSSEPDGEGFEPEVRYLRGAAKPRITPMAMDYETVGVFYASLGQSLTRFVERIGESAAFCGDPALQLSPEQIDLNGVRPVICSKTALAAFDAIVQQGEGAQEDSAGSHFNKFGMIRAEFEALKLANPKFAPAHPAAVNPVLRQPPRREGRVWLENEEAVVCVDLANSAYALMLRLIAYAYAVPSPDPEKALAVDLGIGLMRALTPLAERAARLPAGPSNPGCNAGISFVALRDAASFPQGAGARRFFTERFDELVAGAAELNKSDSRLAMATRLLADLAARPGARAGLGVKLEDIQQQQTDVGPAARDGATCASSPLPAPHVLPPPSSNRFTGLRSGPGLLADRGHDQSRRDRRRQPGHDPGLFRAGHQPPRYGLLLRGPRRERTADRPALGSRRKELVIATKGGIHWSPEGRQVLDARPATLRRECEESLRRLGTDRVELYYLHAPDKNTPIADSAGELKRLLDEGKILAAGASNVTLAQLEEFAAVCPLAAFQPPYNMLLRQIEADTLPWCRRQGMAVMAYWPFMKGLLAGRIARDQVSAPTIAVASIQCFTARSGGRTTTWSIG